MKKKLILFLLFHHLTSFSQENYQIINSDIKFQIKNAYDINDYNLTIKLYENLFSEIHLIDDETNYYYISSLLNHFKTNKIKNEIEKYINLNGGKFSNKLSYEFGKFQFNKNNFKNAIKYLSKIKGDSDEINYMIGISYYNNKSYNKAFEYLKIVKNEKFNDKTNFSLGVISYSLNNFYESLDYFDKIRDDSYSQKTLQYLISINFLNNEFDEVIKLRKSLSDKSENKDYITYYVAKSYFKLEKYKEALTFYHKLNSLIDRDNEINFSIAISNYKLKNYEKAIKIFKDLAFTINDYTQLSSYYLGEIYTQENMLNYALNSYYAAYNIKNDSVYTQNSLLNYAKINYVIGNHDLSIASLEKLKNQYPYFNSNEINQLLGENYFMTNNYNKIIKYIESLDNITDNSKKKYQIITYQKGVDHFNKGNFKNSINYFKLSMKYQIDRNIYFESILNISEALFIGNKFFESNEELLKIFNSKLSPPKNILIKANLALGYSYFNLNEYNSAIKHFEYYLRNSNNSKNLNDIILRLADSYYASKDFNKSIKVYNQVNDYNNIDYINYQKALCYYGMNNNNESILFLDKVLNNNNSSLRDDAVFRKAQIFLESSDFDNSVKYYSDLIKNYKTSSYIPYSYLNRATSLFNLKAYEQAEKDFIFILDNILSENILNEALLGMQKIVPYTNNYNLLNKYVESYRNKFPKNKNIEIIQYETLRNLYFNQKYNEFIKSSKKYRIDNGVSLNLLEINFYTAESFFRQTKYDSAINFYESVIDSLNTKYYSRSLNRIALIKQKQNKFEESLKFYKILNKISKNNREKIDSYVGIIYNYFYLNNTDSLSYYSQQINKYEKISFTNRNKINLLIAKSYLKNDNESAAIDMLLTTINLVKDESAAEAQYLLAELFFNKNENKQALETLYTLNENFLTQDYWVGKSYLLIAKIFISMNEKFQASATLNSLIENSKIDEIKKEASNLLLEINTNE
jgi:tetratricopeptide (TPR) repeat protein